MLKQQNIVIVSTPRRENADRYAAVARLIVYGAESAPHGTVKGVIRGVPLTDTAQEINDYIVHEYNPTALQANRIGKTMSVVIAFNGPKVPNYVKYGNLLVECSLYRKQIDEPDLPRLRRPEPQRHPQVCTQVQPLRRRTPHCRQDVQGSIQDSVRGAEAEMEAAESRQRRDGGRFSTAPRGNSCVASSPRAQEPPLPLPGRQE